jgi:HemY protein
MTQFAETRGLGLRGLFVEARRRGDGAEAGRHAAHATELDVFLPWAHEATLLAQCRARDWQAALATLERNHRLGAMGAGELRRAKAALLAARAIDLKRAEPREALQAASKALNIDPGLTPAATVAVSLLAHGGRQRKAARVIESAWRIAPHPDLAEAYLDLHPNASAAERLKQVTKLTALKPDHEESRVALAQGFLAARQFGEARAALTPLADAKPTARVCLLMAEIEETEHGMTGLAREWLARAAHAPRDPVWIADGTISPHWLAVEPESGRIGVFVWQHPPEVIPASPPPRRVPAVVPPAVRETLPVPTASEIAPMRAPDAPAIEAQGEPIPIAASPQVEVSHDRPVPKGVPNGLDASKDDSGKPPSTAVAGETIAAPTPSPQSAKMEAVAFPLERAPDDPGAEKPRGKGFWQRLVE